ncbi:MAG: glycosyltransferase family 2 protein [Microthrixaceae bacterium]
MKADSIGAVAGASPPAMYPADLADLAVVIVSYQCRELVVACVDALEAAPTRCSYEVVVVDNGSSDGTEQALAGRCRVVQMGRNSGFSVANNAGFAATDSRHVLVLNPDTIVDPGALDALVGFLDAHPEVGMVAPRLVNADGSDQRTARSFPTPAAAVFGRRSPLTRWFPNNRYSARYLPADGTGDEGAHPVDWVSGAAMAVPRSVVDATGGFDEHFFMFWEDADWCRRLHDSGYEVWCEPAARIVHDEGGTRGKGYSPRLNRAFHTGAYLYWRNHHAPQAWNPLRWLAAAGLGGRAAALMGVELVRRCVRTRPARGRTGAPNDHTSAPLGESVRPFAARSYSTESR